MADCPEQSILKPVGTVGVLRAGVETATAIPQPKPGLASMHPAYFAMVMATGIVSVGSNMQGHHKLAVLMLYLNVGFYATLWVLTLLRAAIYGSNVWADLIDHNRGVGFFTAVAATCVLGSQFAAILSDYPPAQVLLWFAIALWAILMYTIFTAFTIKENKPSLSEGINGGWLAAVVATQAVANLAGLVLPRAYGDLPWVHFFSLTFWLCGGMLYIWVISLIFYRYTFFRLAPSDLMPPYWINMGAMAISTLAGSRLIINARSSEFLAGFLPFLKGFTVFFWATATWWVPMLAILFVWRHVYRRFKLRYDPLYWGAVFPLGMYSASTYQLAQVLDLPFLNGVARVFIYIALSAWCLAFAGLVRGIVRLPTTQSVRA
ncbi:MAG: tellurite resistance/C4-dicarboxylate transporter family protein [Candidatus Hydrogenedentes bacterium]|nr:tellurite resistance/C4-dicarboxylate transporter family protein [Candidatus Hydrogenedentota bacterium]